MCTPRWVPTHSSRRSRRAGGDGWLAVCKLPPGSMRSGTRFACACGKANGAIPFASRWMWPPKIKVSDRFRPTSCQPVTDGKTWDRWRVKVGAGSCLSLWARGIPDGCGMKQLLVLLNGMNLPAIYVSRRTRCRRREASECDAARRDCRRERSSFAWSARATISAPVDVELTK